MLDVKKGERGKQCSRVGREESEREKQLQQKGRGEGGSGHCKRDSGQEERNIKISYPALVDAQSHVSGKCLRTLTLLGRE